MPTFLIKCILHYFPTVQKLFNYQEVISPWNRRFNMEKLMVDLNSYFELPKKFSTVIT